MCATSRNEGYIPSKIHGRLQQWRELWNIKTIEDKVQSSIVLVFLGRILS